MTDAVRDWAHAAFVTMLALGAVVAIACAALALLATTLAFVVAKVRELGREPWPTIDRPKGSAR